MKRKNITNAKLVKNEESKETIEELEEKLSLMKSDKANKCDVARDQLVETLEVTARKYFTVTGTAEALRVIRFITGDSASLPLSLELDLANLLAHDMAKDVEKMIGLAKELPHEEMDKLCDSFYDTEFVVKANDPDELADAIRRTAYEMMRIDLCRNVGGAAEDMVSFVKRTDEEIQATQDALDELVAESK